MKVSKIAAIGMTVKNFDKDEIIVNLAALQKRTCQLEREVKGHCRECAIKNMCIDIYDITQREMKLMKLE